MARTDVSGSIHHYFGQRVALQILPSSRSAATINCWFLRCGPLLSRLGIHDRPAGQAARKVRNDFQDVPYRRIPQRWQNYRFPFVVLLIRIFRIDTLLRVNHASFHVIQIVRLFSDGFDASNVNFIPRPRVC